MRKLFRKNTTDNTEQEAHAMNALLPAGYDNPESDFYVAEEYRTAYVSAEPALAEILRHANALVDERARTAVEEAEAAVRQWNDDHPNLMPRRRERPEDVYRTSRDQGITPDIDRLANHRVRKNHSIAAVRAKLAAEEAQRAAAAEAERSRLSRICPVCAIEDVQVDSFTLHVTNPLPMRACAPCADLLTTEYATRLTELYGGLRLEDGRTRAERALDYFDAHVTVTDFASLTEDELQDARLDALLGPA